jgi:putative NADH-flavin reductase
MKIALIGGSGNIGSRILNEALSRGHQVTVIARDPTLITQCHENLTVVEGDILDPESIAEAASEHEVVISAYGPPEGKKVGQLAEATRSLLKGVKRASGVKRLITVGGAGTLKVAPGVKLLDTVFLPKEERKVAIAHQEAKQFIKKHEDDLDWTILSPAMTIAPGKRTGIYRTGKTKLIVDDEGKSEISTEDYAVALLDEVENHRFSRKQFTVGY